MFMGCRPQRDRARMIWKTEIFERMPSFQGIVMPRIRTGTATSRPRVKRRSESGVGAWPLTAREVDVLKLLSRGYTYTEIGPKLGISLHTVTSHIKKSYRKLGVHSAAAAVTRAAELHLLDKTKDG